MGVATAALMWAATAQAGLAVLLSSIAGLNSLLRIAGAAVLIALGARLIVHPKSAAPEISDNHGTIGRSLLALLFCRNQPRRLYARLGASIDRTVGGVFVLVGARLMAAANR
jgi:threonine/homoserine/homoserine lactone efflux protein